MIVDVDVNPSNPTTTLANEQHASTSRSSLQTSIKAWRRSRKPHRLLSHTRLLVLALGGVALLGRLLSPTFFSLPNMRSIMLNVSILGMLALGMTLVMLLREIDLSVGSLMAFAPIAAVTLADAAHRRFDTTVIMGGNIVVGGTVLIIVITLALGALIGLVNGFISVRGPVPSVIVTLGMLFALRGSSYVVSEGNQFYLTDLPEFMWLGSATVFEFVPVSFLIFAGVGLLGIFALRYTKAGRRIYSIGGNEKAAVYSGVRTRKWKILAFVLSGLCAGVAALFFSSRLGSAEAGQASGFELSAIAIAVVGGTTLEGGRGTILNTMLSSVLLAFVMNIIALRGIVIWYQTVIIGVIIIGAGIIYSVRDRRDGATP